MNQREFGSVLFAVAGVFIAITSIPEVIAEIGVVAGSRADISVAVSVLVGSVVNILLGVFLLIYRDALARWLFKSSTSAPISVGNFQAPAFAVLGAYFVVRGLSGPLFFGGQVQYSYVAFLVLGVLLFFGAKGISHFWHIIRYSGGHGN